MVMGVLKSEKKPVGKIFLILWLVVLVGFFGLAVLRYSEYREIQDAGVAIMAAASSEYSGDDHAEVVRDIYADLTRSSFLGQSVGDISRDLRDALEGALEALGYDVTWVPFYFEYTSFPDFFFGNYLFGDNAILMLCIYVVMLVLLVFTVIYLKDRGSGLTVTPEAVICQRKPGKTVQCLYPDIASVEKAGLGGVKLKGSGIAFKCLFLKNGDELQKAIQDRKMAVSRGGGSSNADSLGKFKELLDSGAISQEEYDAKKRELLNL